MPDLEEKLAVIIEDDADVRHLLKTVLTQSGFQTILTTNGEDGIEAVRAHNPVLTTLDVSMPGMDGFAAAKRIREFSGTYIMMLTALADEIDVVQGLDSGADDYLLKPFRPRELRARIETLLRRPRERDGVGGALATAPAPVAVSAPAEPVAPAPVAVAEPVPQPAVVVQAPVASEPVVVPVRAARQPVHEPAPAVVDSTPTADGWLEHRGLQLNTQTRHTRVDGRGVELTRSEFDLLATLMASGRRVRSKADLVLALRGESYVTTYYVNDADKRAVEVHMANLRRKIGDSSATPRFIETVRGVGYRLASDSDTA
ncbi:response regulator transcription factor [Aeromicrobium wangtongii]|uniref:response regulator transcription factor n=1 Tax=Aeromicrobium wangtongii TaxID=2969247 RepID=UPI0020175359|nr:response regulator transcription factor [Aeromicrobium wangtongii]MCL3817830.1 response regulator transcription factor [Aeromicrobium wangtongii]